MNPRSLSIALLAFLGQALPLHADDTAAVAAVAAAVKLGKSRYTACAACHGADAKGIETSPGRLIASDLSKSQIVRGDAEWMALIVMKGLRKENARYLGTKTPLETSLDDEELAAILTFVRNTWGGKKDRVTDEQVAGWRKKYADIKQPLRQADIQKRLQDAAR